MELKNITWILGLYVTTVFAQDPKAQPSDINIINNKIQNMQSQIDKIEKEITKIKIQGKFEELALDKANLTPEEILNWVTEGILDIYSYNFLNYQNKLNSIRSYFSELGYDSYMKALEASKNLDAVKTKKLVVHAIVGGVPKIENQGVIDGVYRWEVEVPLLVTYQNSTQEFSQNILINAEVVRVPYKVSKKGIAIHAIKAKLIEKEAKPNSQTSIEIKVPEKKIPEQNKKELIKIEK